MDKGSKGKAEMLRIIQINFKVRIDYIISFWSTRSGGLETLSFNAFFSQVSQDLFGLSQEYTESYFGAEENVGCDAREVVWNEIHELGGLYFTLMSCYLVNPKRLKQNSHDFPFLKRQILLKTDLSM